MAGKRGKLGNRQQLVLSMLKQKGPWSWDCGWAFRKDKTITQHTLDSLIGHGLVSVQQTAVVMKNGKTRLIYHPMQPNGGQQDR